MIYYEVETVFVAMSGGMDSSYSAYLLKQAGYKVVGFTFDLLPSSMRSASNPRMCCSAAQMERARRIADGLSIPHYVINMREEFESNVIARFVREYAAGRTPNPCILCNRHIKFDSFLRKAAAMGADRVATGHYAGVEETPQGFALKKGKDRAKDQSYFLYPIRYEDLPRLSFPLASRTKVEVRTASARMEGRYGETAESQDICFIPGGDYRAFIGEIVPEKKGPIVTVEGREIGFHRGMHLYTIGQRRGVNIPYREALYVVAVRPEDNAVVVGPKEALLSDSLTADEVNVLGAPLQGEARAKVRYRQKEELCSYALRDGILEVAFRRPVSAVAPGQAVVLYDGERVLGGGTITGARLRPGSAGQRPG